MLPSRFAAASDHYDLGLFGQTDQGRRRLAEPQLADDFRSLAGVRTVMRETDCLGQDGGACVLLSLDDLRWDLANGPVQRRGHRR